MTTNKKAAKTKPKSGNIIYDIMCYLYYTYTQGEKGTVFNSCILIFPSHSSFSTTEIKVCYYKITLVSWIEVPRNKSLATQSIKKN